MAAKADVTRRIEMILSGKQRRGNLRPTLIIAGLVAGLSICLAISTAAFASSSQKNTPPAADIENAVVDMQVRVYQATSPGAMRLNHHSFVEKGAKCTDCHRTVNAGGGVITAAAQNVGTI